MSAFDTEELEKSHVAKPSLKDSGK